MGIELILDMAAGAAGDRVALGRRDTGLTYADLARAADGGAALLRKSGARSVAYVGLNGPVLPALIFAAARAGIPLTPLNYRLSGVQLGELLAELDHPFVVADHAYAAVVPADALSEDWLDRALQTEPTEQIPVDDENPAVVLFTSGTTSKPKGVVLRHAHLLSYVLETVEFGAAEGSDAVLVSVPPYHIAGVGSVLSNLYAGRRMTYLPDFNPGAWLHLVREDQVTHAMVVPTMLARIVAELDGAQADTPSLRSMAYGGARMPQTVLRAALKAFPNTDFVNAYGLTETSSTIAVLGPEDHRAALQGDPIALERLGSVGRMVPGVECQVRDEAGEPLPRNTTGEIWVRGGQVSGEYQGVGSVLDSDGWFPTRDRGRLDEDNYLFVEGRADDTIIRGGENIAPAEVEDVLLEHPAVDQVAVLGAPDEEWGERIVAVVVPVAGSDPDPEDLRAFVRARVRSSRTPDDVVFRTELPYTATGKLLRRELARHLS
ncbi:class I adenylate-forming enzyme family protein [Nocardia cerradoensis]|uniref:Long-chain-fatty-acid--CoA ligase n=1 Tax=Nocardia cerradoensis TaxID=85688 RepID=A0A231GUW8_9NOCA|nr:AMP-binding protein [Nocardia cerradoensis]NKY43648.1 long-chain fatty acid--CoA ligase [Nocardia cerradoensis]OXR40423.1 Long-chain-fatty-acid--CoA ligase [Nocardia cerradoensis]